MICDPEQRIYRLVGMGNGFLLEARVTGELRLWKHTGAATGTATWVSPLQIGTGWNDYAELLADHNGALYVIYADGRIRRFRWVITDVATGAGYWESNAAGPVVATGWNRFRRVFGGPDGVIYGVAPDGGLWRSQYANGALSAPVQIGSDWQDCSWLAGDAGGVIYGIRFGVLQWWRYVSGAWVNGGPAMAIGDNAWALRSTRAIVAGGNGILYHVELNQKTPPGPDGDLYADRISNYQSVLPDGRAVWTYNGRSVGTAWTVERLAALQGYATPQTVAAGGTVQVAVSSPHDPLTASVWRHAPGSSPIQVTPAAAIAGGIQPVATGYRSAGCGWASRLTVPVDPSWPSGVYSARIEGPAGLRQDLAFVVKPSAPMAPLAVILPTATYNAYNEWGGHSQYTAGWAGAPRTLTFDRPSYTLNVEATGRLDCELLADLYLLRWLSANGYSYAVYGDQDLHADPGLLGRYRAVALGAHPEYVTDVVRQALLDYTRAGGRLLYCGGNGIYEPVTISGNAVTFRAPDGLRHEYYTQGVNASEVVGVTFHDASARTFAPYKIVADHPILAGTGLKVGDVIGAGGYNHHASGIEYDWADPAYVSQCDVIARGQNPGGGADMVLADRPNGGLIFSAGSITFPTSLSEPGLSALFRAVVDRAIKP